MGISKLTTNETKQVWKDYKADQSNQDLRNQLIETYLPLVRYNAERVWKKLPEEVELDDLKSAGTFGLIDAIEAYDLERGVKFETYCVPRIRGAMLDELRTMDWVPRLARSKSSKLEYEVKKAEEQLGRPPTDDEMAYRLDMTHEEFQQEKTNATPLNLVSLNKKLYETDSYKDVREIDVTKDPKGEDPTVNLQNKDALKLACKGLNRDERLIMIGYYYNDQTMKEIGNSLGLSESRVSQLHSSIIMRLQDRLTKGDGRRDEFEAAA
jgi:RNA polymerase sigma factor FliA